MKMLLTITSILLAIYFVIGAYLYVNQRSLLYFPQPYTQHTYPSITLTQPNAALNIITLRSTHTATSKKPALIYFGGNAEAVIHSAPLFEPLNASYDIYLVNYRGYGESTGQMTEVANYADALAVYAAVAKQHESITVVGRSLGTGVASYLAQHKPVHKLVLITPYDSIRAVAQAKFPMYPVGILLKDTYPSVTRAADITAKTLILAAANDRVIPPSHANTLAKAFSSKPQYTEIKAANHANIMQHKSSLAQFYTFLASH